MNSAAKPLADRLQEFTLRTFIGPAARANKREITIRAVFTGQRVGVRQVNNSVWLISFMQYDLGYFDAEVVRLEPIENPFRSDVLPTCPI